jgi:plasmid stabilization system protein ParE
MAQSAQLQAKLRRAKKAIQAAHEEIRLLMSHSKAGTLDRRKLESGLRKVKRKMDVIPDHDGP